MFSVAISIFGFIYVASAVLKLVFTLMITLLYGILRAFLKVTSREV